MRKINSEIVLENKDFKIIIGTVDKKNPNSIFMIFGVYVLPEKDNEDPKSNMKKITTNIHNKLCKIIDEVNLCENSRYIIDTDISIDRIFHNKKSFLEIQAYCMPKTDILTSNGYNFETIAKLFGEKICPKITEFIDFQLKENGFLHFKTKSDTIYHENNNECKTFS